MGAKYSSVSISGYNATPPADDGSTSASNQVTWAKHKTKLGDPVKTAVEAINSGLVTALDYSSRLITSSDSTLAGDSGKTIVLASTITATVTVSLMDAATAAAGYIVTISNESTTVTHTVGRATASNTISSVTADYSLPPLSAISFVVSPSGLGYSIRSTVGVTLTGTQTLTNKTLTSPVIDTAVTGTAIATQAQMETASATDVLVTPSNFRSSLYAWKVWGKCGVAGDLASPSAGISSITDTGTGRATVNFSVNFSTGNYAAWCNPLNNTTSNFMAFIANTQAVGSMLMVCINAGTGGATDPTTGYTFGAAGDQQ